ncbi:uncharacterized protein [Antedon mediterranea]|uniref:uncharacterized protein n=1 Tax=Antedon mediterranea TaxID=105859 RepID=UPI003AF5E2BB
MKIQITLACLLAVVVYCSGRRIKRPNCDSSNGKKVDGFSCGDGQCIWKSLQCDGQQDCFNRFDEEDTLCGVDTYVCKEDEFDCGDGSCISASKRCNNKRECKNGDDEKNCDDMYLIRPNCDETNGKPVNGIDCGDGQCILTNQLCNDVQDCFNRMDESSSTCPDKFANLCTKTEFQCGDSKQCVPLTDRCDGNKDCRNNADEYKCSNKKSCGKGKIDCGDGVCYKLDKLCDGRQDCFNNSDEKHCTPNV